MADVITRLRLESGEFDSKIKRATQGLLQMEQDCRKVGGTLAILESDQKKYVQSLGQMDTVSRTVKGTLAELTQAYTELSVQYKRLTDEEKSGDFGKALSSSLDQLKSRINDTKSQLNEVSTELGNTGNAGSQTGGILEELAGKLGLNIKSLGALGVALGATKAAMDVVSDAFMSSESNVDEWNMTIESGKSVYDSFLLALNSGNFSTFFNNLDNVVSKARAAYNALDNLNTMMTIINPERAKLQARQTELKATIRREGPKSESGQKAQQELKKLEPALSASYQRESQMNYNAFKAEVQKKLAEAGLNLTQKSFNVVMESFSDARLFENLQRNARGEITMKSGTSHPGAGAIATKDIIDNRNTNQKILDLFTDEWRQQYSPYLTASFTAKNQAQQLLLGDARYLKEAGVGGGGVGRTGSSTNTTSQTPPPEGSIVEQEQKVKELTDAWKNATAQAGREGYLKQLEEAKKVLDEMQGKVKEIVPEGSIKALSEKISELNKQRELLNDGDDIAAIDNQIRQLKEMSDFLQGKGKQPKWEDLSLEDTIRQQMDADAKKADQSSLSNLIRFSMENNLQGMDFSQEKIKLEVGIDISDEEWQTIVDQINAKLAELGIEPIQLNFKTGNIEELEDGGKSVKESWSEAASSIGTVSGALASIKNPAAQIAATIGQAIATIAQAYAENLAEDVTTKGNIWAFIAASAAAVTSMITTISAVKSNAHYAEGGIIGGKSFSGDNQQMPVSVNAGELILNRSQQGIIADAISGNNAFDNLRLESRIAGEDIIVALTNSNNRRFKGSYVMNKRG